ncbi:hypothetical protein [Halorussus sp. AFM4]|uniref:hypothetical protein n=1 Tax=Halorussus sp. AFM4 TaxID=3421651 RepID=UPI003EBF6B7F
MTFYWFSTLQVADETGYDIIGFAVLLGTLVTGVLTVAGVALSLVEATVIVIASGLTLAYLRRQSTSLGWVLLASVWFFCLGLLGGLAAGLAAAITGALCWWLFIERRGVLTYRQGAAVGYLIQGFAYPVLYLLSGFLGLPAGADNRPTFTYSGVIPSGAEVVDILVRMVMWHEFYLIGIILTGPVGIAGGLVLVALRRRVPPESGSQ